MKIVADEISATGDAEDLIVTARLALETGIRLTRLARHDMGARQADTLSLSRLRALSYLADHPGASVKDLANHLWVGAPTASKIADALSC